MRFYGGAGQKSCAAFSVYGIINNLQLAKTGKVTVIQEKL